MLVDCIPREYVFVIPSFIVYLFEFWKKSTA